MLAGGLAAEPLTNPPPAPLRIGHVRFSIRDIYTPAEIAQAHGLLRFVRRSMNAVHTSTRHYVLRQELLFQPGDPFDPALLAETERNMRELGFLHNVRIVPVDTLADGRIDLEVRAQEVWSLQTQFALSRASEGSLRWSVFLSDDNFLGYGLQAGVGLGETEDYSYHQLSFQQRRFLGSRWRLRCDGADLGDGFSESISLARPFYAQDDPFQLKCEAWRGNVEKRFYLSNAGPAGRNPAQAASLHALLETAEDGAQLSTLLRISPPGRGRIWRVGAGLEVHDLEFHFDGPDLELSDDRHVPYDVLTAPGSPLLREEGLAMFPYLQLETLGRQWTTTRYLLQYGSVEDVLLDPALTLKIGPTFFPEDSHTRPRLGLEYEAADWSRAGPGFLLLQAGGSAALDGRSGEGTAALWHVVGWVGRYGAEAHPRQTRLFAEVDWGQRLLGTDAFVLGLNRGLRTLAFDGMAGDRLVRWNAEQGWVLPLDVLGFYRAGLAAFYAGGMAWWHDEKRGPEDVRHEVGIGLRFGSTRSARMDMARLDLTWAPGEDGGPVLTAVTRGLF